MGNPFDALPSYTDPLKSPSTDNPFDLLDYSQQTQPNLLQKYGMPVLDTLGTVLSPLQAPQQVLFGATRLLQGGFAELIQGQSGAAVRGLQDAGRSLEAGLGYLSFGGLGNKSKAVTGRELMKNAGAPEWVQQWGGLAADILFDPSNLIGGVGAATKAVGLATKSAKLVKTGEKVVRAGQKLERLTNLYRAPENVLNVFGATPTVSRYLRDVIAEGVALPDVVSDALKIDPAKRRAFGIDPEASATPTLAEQFLPNSLKKRWLPDKTVRRIEAQEKFEQDRLIYLKQADLELKGVHDAFAAITNQLSPADVQEWRKLTYLQQSATTNAEHTKAVAELTAFANRVGKPQLVGEAQRAIAKATSMDAKFGRDLVGVGLSARGIQSGQDMPAKVRRDFLAFGQQGEAYIQKVYAMKAPSKFILDEQRLTDKIQSWADNFEPQPVGVDSTRYVKKAVPVEYQGVTNVDLGGLDITGLDTPSIVQLRNALRSIGNQVKIGKDANGRYAFQRGTFSDLPLNHPVINQFLNADEIKYISDGTAGSQPTIIQAIEKQHVPNWFNPDGNVNIDDAMAMHQNDLETPNLLDTAFKETVRANSGDIAKSMIAYFTANENANVLDALKSTIDDYQLDPVRAEGLLRSMAGQSRTMLNIPRGIPGVLERQPSTDEIATQLRIVREQKLGGYTSGSGLGTDTAVSQRQVIEDPLLREYGEIQDAFKQYAEQAHIVSKVVSEKQVLLDTRALIEAEYGKIYRFDDVANMPKEINESLLAGDGLWRTLPADLADGFGVFKQGDVVPSWHYRSFMAAKMTQDNADKFVVLQRASQIWKVTKLSNPASILRNVTGGIVQADNGVTVHGKSYRVNPLEMATGIFQYFKALKDPAQIEEAVNAGLHFGSFSKDDITRASNEIGRVLADSKTRKLNPLDAVLSYLEASTGARPGALDDASPLLQAAAKYNPLSAAGRVFFAGFSKSEELMKGSIYFALKGKIGAAEAASVAEEALFNYGARPLAVSAVSKLGIDPFVTFKAFSVGRQLENIYDRPAAIARTYRVAPAVNDAVFTPEEQQQNYDSMDKWLKKKMPIPIGGKDQYGRQYFIPMADLLPGGAFTNVVDDSNNTGVVLGGLVNLPPAFQLYNEVIAGVGFQGRKTYQGLGPFGATPSLATAEEYNFTEASRRAAKVVMNFMGYPWQPGSPMMDRLATAIAARMKSGEELAAEAGATSAQSFQDAAAQFALRTLKEGVLQYSEGADPVVGGYIQSDGEGGGEFVPGQNLESTVGRLAGFTSYPVQTDVNKPTGASAQIKRADTKVKTVKAYWSARLRDLAGKGARQNVLDAATREAEKQIAQAEAELDALTARLGGN